MQSRLFIIASLQGFYSFISNPTHSAVHCYRIGSLKLLTLRLLYPRAPSRPSASPCRMSGLKKFEGVQSSSGALKHLALKSKSETFSCVLPINSHTQRFGLSVSSRRCPSSFYESYRMGGTSTSTSLRSQLVQAVIPPQHDASAEKDPPAVLFSIHIPILDSV